jgi:hypothetical protein
MDAYISMRHLHDFGESEESVGSKVFILDQEECVCMDWQTSQLMTALVSHRCTHPTHSYSPTHPCACIVSNLINGSVLLLPFHFPLHSAIFVKGTMLLVCRLLRCPLPPPPHTLLVPLLLQQSLTFDHITSCH